MKCQRLFSGGKKTKKNNINLFSAELARGKDYKGKK